MRGLLKKAVALNPEYTESYELLAFVDLVNNEELDDAVLNLRREPKYQPGTARNVMRIAKIYLRQDKFKHSGSKPICPQNLTTGAYRPGVEGLQFGCGIKNVDVPVIFVFRRTTDAKAKSAGELLSLEFVPKSFSLN